ncbi:hypothetical protein [Litorivita sp. NS0012-18]|uniref:hypothetical protein n=1 Tax=Litorivita sp. NS0012-18 TaxID=3127655 RepID=UPI0031081C01
MSFLSRMLDGFFGRGNHAITVPALDGALRPNMALDRAERLASGERLDNICALGDAVFYTTGAQIRRLGTKDPIATLDDDVAFLVARPSNEAMIAGLADGTLLQIGIDAMQVPLPPMPDHITCPTAAALGEDNRLYVANGSKDVTLGEWPRDLLEKGASGSIWRIDLDQGAAQPVAQGLEWPAGIAMRGKELLVSESWRARLVRIDVEGGKPREVLGNLPGYPGRISAGADGQAYVTVFAPRSQLLAFVLREDKYRRAMIDEVDPQYWIAPSLRSGSTFLEPLQAGSVKQLGVLKPWAPTRSFGLIIALGADDLPLKSYHSRADGAMHGVTSCCETGAGLYFSAKGDGQLGRLSPAAVLAPESMPDAATAPAAAPKAKAASKAKPAAKPKAKPARKSSKQEPKA